MLRICLCISCKSVGVYCVCVCMRVHAHRTAYNHIVRLFAWTNQSNFRVGPLLLTDKRCWFPGCNDLPVPGGMQAAAECPLGGAMGEGIHV